MKIKHLIDKLRRGEPLNALETAELDGFDPEALRTKLEELRSQLEAAENAKLSDGEKLQKELSRAVAERDAAVAAHRKLKRSGQVERLAAEAGFGDAAYLNYLAGESGVDLDDPAASAAFIAGLRDRMPGFFAARVRPGGGPVAGGSSTPALPAESAPRGGTFADRLGGLLDQLAGAPELL